MENGNDFLNVNTTVYDYIINTTNNTIKSSYWTSLARERYNKVQTDLPNDKEIDGTGGGVIEADPPELSDIIIEYSTDSGVNWSEDNNWTNKDVTVRITLKPSIEGSIKVDEWNKKSDNEYIKKYTTYTNETVNIIFDNTDRTKEDTKQVVIDINIDKDKPIIDIDETSLSTGIISLKATDTLSGIKLDSFKVNGTSSVATPSNISNGYEYKIDISTLNSGENTFTIEDNAGNSTSAKWTKTTIDMSKASISDKTITWEKQEDKAIQGISITTTDKYNFNLSITIPKIENIASYKVGIEKTNSNSDDTGNRNFFAVSNNTSITGSEVTFNFAINDPDNNYFKGTGKVTKLCFVDVIATDKYGNEYVFVFGIKIEDNKWFKNTYSVTSKWSVNTTIDANRTNQIINDMKLINPY